MTPVIQTIASRIAEELSKATNTQWTLSAALEDENWRAEIQGPGEHRLFLSNTWAGNGRLYISGSFPNGAALPYNTERPSITVAENKDANKIAADIKRRLLPAYVELLTTVLINDSRAKAFEASRASLAEEVAKVVGGRVQGQMVYSKGWDLQVCSPDSIRINGNCNYLTIEQLKKIAAACPELFAGKPEGDFAG